MLYTAFLLLSCYVQAQQIQISSANTAAISSRYNLEGASLQPVYFNFSRRLLFSDKQKTTRIHPKNFLQECRGINNAEIQNQIARYDHLTQNKKILTGTMIACAVSSYALLMAGSSMISSSYPSGQGANAVLCAGVSLLLATPVLAISTSIPHQKRKEILFRDLPNAYNFYALSQPK